MLFDFPLFLSFFEGCEVAVERLSLVLFDIKAIRYVLFFEQFLLVLVFKDKSLINIIAWGLVKLVEYLLHQGFEVYLLVVLGVLVDGLIYVLVVEEFEEI